MINKKVMLVACLLLAFITIGAVSAADDLAAADLGGENQNVIASPTQDNLDFEKTAVADDNLVGNGEQKDLDIDSSVVPSKANISDYVDFDIALPDDFYGGVTFEIFADEENTYKYDYYCSGEAYIHVYCPPVGTYAWNLTFSDFYENYRPLTLTGNIEIVKKDLTFESDFVPSEVVGTDEHYFDIPLPSDFEGTVVFKLNESVVFSDTSFMYWDDVEYYPPRLGLFNWNLSLESDRYNPVTLNGTMKVLYLRYNVPEHVIIGSDDRIDVYLAEGLEGTVKLLIDGEEFTSIDLEDYWGHASIDISDVTVKNHTYELIYSDDDYFEGFSVNGTFDVDYVFEAYDKDVIYGDSATISVRLPFDASGKLTAVLNGKTFELPFNRSNDREGTFSVDMELSNFSLGENTVAISYTESKKYPKKSLNVTVNTYTKIRYEDEMDFTKDISLILPPSANGNLIVRIDDKDFANVSGKAGIFNVSLSQLKMGIYDLGAYYEGDDFEVGSVYDSFEITPKITAPDFVGYYEGALVTIEVPQNVNGTFNIYKFNGEYWQEDEDYMTLVNSTQITNGKATVLITTFDDGSEDDYNANNRFRLEFVSEDYTYKHTYRPTMKYYERDIDFEIDVPDIVNGKRMECIVHDKMDRTYEIYFDDVFYATARPDYDYDLEEYTIVLYPEKLDFTKHKIEFRYEDSDGFYVSKNRAYFFNVTYIAFDIPKEIVLQDYAYASVDESLKGNLTLFIDGVQYDVINIDEWHSPYFSIEDLDFATHDWEMVYSGDATHDKVTFTGSFNFTYSMDAELKEDGKTYAVVVRMPYDVKSDVTLNFNGKKYTARAHDYTEFVIDNVKMGENEYSVTYAGDDKYPAKTISNSYYKAPSISIEGDKVVIDSFSNSTGALVVSIDETEFKTVNLTDGKASVDLSGLDLGEYELYARYVGDDYKIGSIFVYYDNYNITYPDYVGIEEGALITVNMSGNYSGKLIIQHRVFVDYDWYDGPIYENVVVNTTDIINGYASVRLTEFDGITPKWSEKPQNRYIITVALDNGTEYSEYYFPTVLPKSSDFGFDISMPSEVLKRSYVEVETNIPYRNDKDSNAGYANVYIDGDYYRRFYDDISLDVSDLDYGTHTVTVQFSGDEYYLAKNASASFNVTCMVADKLGEVGIYGDSTYASGIYFDENTTGFVNVYLDGKVISTDFASLYVGVELANLTVGDHTLKVVYSGDASHEALTRIQNFTVVYGGYINDVRCYENDTTIQVRVVDNATGNVELTVDGKKYTQKAEEGWAEFHIDEIAPGVYEAAAKYLGDGNYPAYDISSQNITVESGLAPRSPFIKGYEDSYIEVTPKDEVIIALELPEGAEGKLIVELDDKVYGSADLENGKAYVNLTGLDYGYYDIYAYYSGDYDGRVYSLYGAISVNPKYGDYNSSYVFGSEVVIPIEFVSDMNGDLLVSDIDDKLVMNQTVADGKVTLNLTDKVKLGHNRFSLVFKGDKYHFEGSVVVFISPVVEYPQTMTAGDDEYVVYTFPEGFNGNITVYFRGDTRVVIEQQLKDGKAIIPLFNFSADRYVFSFEYVDENTHIASHYYDNLILKVLKKEADVEVSKSDKGIKVTFDDNVTGEVIAKIGDEYLYGVLDDGEVTFDATADEVEIFYSGDKNYAGFKNRAVNVTEEKTDLIDPNLTVKASDIDVGGVAVVNIQANSTLNANATLTVNKVDYTIVIKNGKATKSFENLTAGKYDVTVKFDGNDVFAKAKATASFNVDKLAAQIAIDSADRIAEGSNLTVKVTVPGATGTVTVNGKKYTLTNGAADATIANVEAGNLTVEVKYSGDDKYLDASKTKTVTVYAKKDAGLAADNVKINVGDVGLINISIDKDATGRLTVNGTEVSITNGSAKYEIRNLSAGNYAYTIAFAGDDLFKAGEVSVNVTVEKVNASDVEIPQTVSEKDSNLTFEMPEDATGNVTVTVNGKDYPASIKNGKVSVTLDKLPKGSYDYTVTYSGDDKYSAFTKSGVIKVDDIYTYISITQVTGKCVVEGVLKDIEGNAIANAELAVKVGSSNMTVKTDEKGAFTLQARDNTQVTVIFEGKDAFMASNTTVTLKNIVPVRVATKIIGENYTQYAVDYFAGERGGYFKVKLTDASGAPLVNKTVNIGYNGKCLILVSDDDGFVQVQINLLAANTLTFAVAFLGDDKYDASFEVYKITINKKTTSLTAPAKTYKASAKTKSYTVTLKTIKGSSADGKTYLGSGKTITLSVNGKTYTAKTNAKGQATFKLNINKKGTFKATVSYAGDNTYASSKTTANIKIN
ncbi:Ig-like domain-containing protein [uncultured Methanobrevibacter sp.]|uniref:Ig-like domain-containing protein n=1 Tax=uncultured Methanobrevibacter sp. TaxID=253161 RepID=UPI00262FF025|nr:Ig-like domain-containing protein [uncultured Methanobrevibacter sp.]